MHSLAFSFTLMPSLTSETPPPPHITLAFSRTIRPWSLPVSGSTYLPRPRSEVLDTRAGKVPREAGVMGKVRGARDEQTRCAGPTGDKESERE